MILLRLFFRLLAAYLILHALSCNADIAVIVHPNNPVVVLSKKQVSELYFGRARTFPSGDYALVLDLPWSASERQHFFQLLSGMTITQVNTYWSRLMFSGRVLPPLILPDDRAVIDVVQRNPSAIGYISHIPSDDSVRAVLIFKD